MSRKEKKKSDDEPGLGTVLAAGAAVAGVAAVAYGAWKLFDFLNSTQQEAATGGLVTEVVEKKKCVDSSSDEDEPRGDYRRNETQSNPVRREVQSVNDFSNLPSTSSSSSLYHINSLHDRLMGYYSNYADISLVEMKENQRVVKELKVVVSRHLNEMTKLTAAKILDLIDYGDAADGLNVVFPDKFEYLIPIKLDENDWSIQELNDHGQVAVGLKDMSLPVEICDANGKVTPISLNGLLRGVVERAARSCRSYSFNSSSARASMVLEVKYAVGEKKLQIIFLPAIAIGTKLLVPYRQPNSDVVELGDEVYFWKRSYMYEERKSMGRFNPGITNHQIVLKIFLAISLNWPSLFGILNSFHYKTILLRLLEEQPDELDWSGSTLPEHFIDFLIELGSCLKERNLPHNFEKNLNLFDGIPAESLQKLAEFINKLVGKQDFEELLKCEYQIGRI